MSEAHVWAEHNFTADAWHDQRTRLRHMPVRTIGWPILRALWRGDTVIVNATFDGGTVEMRPGGMALCCYSSFRGGTVRLVKS